MGVREDLGYDDTDEAWRRNAERRDRAGATQAAKDIGRVAELATGGPHSPATTAPSGRPVCMACGHETDILHSIPHEVVVLDGVRLVGCVRTSCWSCAGKATAEEERLAKPAARGSVTCQ